MHEAGAQLPGDPRPYYVPGLDDGDYFRLPAGFLANRWVLVLEGSEITALLMVACGLGSLWAGDDTMNLVELGIHVWLDPTS